MKIADDILATIITIETLLKNDPELAEDLEEEYYVLHESFKIKQEVK